MKRKFILPILILSALTACNKPQPVNTSDNPDIGVTVVEDVTEESTKEAPEETTAKSVPDTVYEQGESVPSTPVKNIGIDDAELLAKTHIGEDFAADSSVITKAKEYELDDGVPEYQFEFVKNGVEYSVDVHAETGEILEYETEAAD
ncbi:MAG: PepSY domain-containing protein [Firmicutes bacterium]|nr:PepSY domain-containing protein [Bacillota bacterium]